MSERDVIEATIHWIPQDRAPLNAIVLVAGGIGMKKEDGCWYTGMEFPRFEREIEWTVTHWAHIPEVLIGDRR